jgi:hypothetical protein
MVIGTHTSENEQNYLMIANVRLPTDDTQVEWQSANPDGRRGREDVLDG